MISSSIFVDKQFISGHDARDEGVSWAALTYR